MDYTGNSSLGVYGEISGFGTVTHVKVVMGRVAGFGGYEEVVACD